MDVLARFWFLAAGLVALAGGCGLLAARCRLVITGTRTRATCVGLEAHPNDDGVTHHPVLELRTSDGRSVRVVSGFGGRLGAWRQGADIGVVYPAGQPEKAQIASPLALWSAPAALLALGAAGLAAGLGAG